MFKLICERYLIHARARSSKYLVPEVLPVPWYLRYLDRHCGRHLNLVMKVKILFLCLQMQL